jgi:hypothetical protein
MAPSEIVTEIVTRPVLVSLTQSHSATLAQNTLVKNLRKLAICRMICDVVKPLGKLQNLHPRFKSGRRLQFSFGKLTFSAFRLSNQRRIVFPSIPNLPCV